MLAELSKRQLKNQEAVEYYLKGLRSDPLSYTDNYLDLADLLAHNSDMHLMILSFVKILTAVNEGNLYAIDDEVNTVNEMEGDIILNQ